MEIILDFPPMHSEIEHQLTRMLASPRFANARNPADFLELVVRRKLAGKTTSGSVIAKSLFGGKFAAHISADVRVTASNLRKTLERYYGLEGKDDIVLIALPPPPKDKSIKPVDGQAYTPSFSYNPSFEVLAAVKIGHIWLKRWGYAAQLKAYEIFRDCLKRAPRHIGPTLGLVEVICNFSNRAWHFPERIDPYTTCCKLLGEIEEPPTDYWKLWAVRGLVELRDGDINRAGAAFEKAVSLDRGQTEVFLPYIEYLRTIGKIDESLALANHHLLLHLEESEALVHFAHFLISLQRIEAGIQHLEQAVDMDAGNCAAHEMLAMVGLIVQDVARVVSHLKMLSVLYDQTSYGLFLLELKVLEKKYGFGGTFAKALKELGFGEALITALEVEANAAS